MKLSVYLAAFLFLFTIPILAGPGIGTPAPDFTCPDTANNNHSLSDYQGKVVFLMLGKST